MCYIEYAILKADEQRWSLNAARGKHSCTGAANFEVRCGGARTGYAHPFGARTQALVRHYGDY